MAGALTKYAFINAKLRARISAMLGQEFWSQLIRTASLDAALAMLRDTDFACMETQYNQTGDIKLAELELLKREIGLYKSIRPYVHQNSRAIVDALLLEFEIDNLKNAVRLYFERTVTGRNDQSGLHYVLYEPIVHSLNMDAIVNAGDMDAVAQACDGTPYGSIIAKQHGSVESNRSLFGLEVALDHFFYANLLDAVDALSAKDHRIARRIIGVEIDLHNISWLIRLKDFYALPVHAAVEVIIPGGFSIHGGKIEELYDAANAAEILRGFLKDHYPALLSLIHDPGTESIARLSLIKAILEEIRKQEVKRILSGYPFTIGIILAYFVAKRNELKTLRMILNAKHYGTDPERIENML